MGIRVDVCLCAIQTPPHNSTQHILLVSVPGSLSTPLHSQVLAIGIKKSVEKTSVSVSVLYLFRQKSYD